MLNGSTVHVVRQRDGRYECARCGAVLNIAEDEVPLVTVHGASGRGNERVINVDGVEFHRCNAPNDSAEVRRKVLEILGAETEAT